MKYIIIFVFLGQILFAQSNSEYLEFYPLNIGNYWEYEEVVMTYELPWWLPNFDTTFYSVTVASDTILDNGQSYFILLEHRVVNDDNFYHSSFERIDSLSGNVYRYTGYIEKYECLIDSLKAELGDTIKANRPQFGSDDRPIIVFSKDTSENIFNEYRRMKYFESFADFIVNPFQYGLIQNIGLYEISWSFDFGWHKDRLIYAEINNQKYGHSIFLSINDIEYYPISFTLFQNYPNPFNYKTIIQFYLNRSSNVQLDLYSITGEKLFNIFRGFKSAGSHSIELNGDALSSGIYIYTIKSGNYQDSKKCILIK